MNNIILIHGPDSYRSFQALKEIKRRYLEKNNDLNLIIFEGADLMPNQLTSALNAQPFLSSKRLIIIKNLLAAKNTAAYEALLANLTTVTASTLLVIYEVGEIDQRLKILKELKKIALDKEFPFLSPYGLRQQIDSWCAMRNATITRAARDQLAIIVDNDLWRLRHELDKLIDYNPAITQETVALLINNAQTITVFELLDAIQAGERQMALRKLDKLKQQGENSLGLLALIAGSYRNLISLLLAQKIGLARSFAMAQKLKLHPFVVSKTLPLLKKYTLEKLLICYRYFTDYDAAIKRGIIDEESALDLLVARLVNG